MADRKISQLTSLPQSQFAAGDSIPIVDQSANETKRTTVDELDLRWASKVHSHVISDVTNLQTSLNNKSDVGHAHAISDVTGLQTALNNKSDVGHTHVAADITDFKAASQDVEASDSLLSEYDDFTSSAVAGRLNFTSTAAGTGAAVTLNSVIADTSVYGNRQLSTGTTATGRSTFSLAVDTTYFTGIQHTIEWRARLDNLSTIAVEQFVAYIGWGDNTGAGDQTDGIYFRYDATVSANWLAVTSSNSVREISDTGIPVAALSYNKFRIVVNSTASQAQFFINGVLVATNTLNIPATQARACGPLVKIEKQVGASARLMQVDRVQIDSRRP